MEAAPNALLCSVAALAAATLLLSALWHFWSTFWWTPLSIQTALKKQGIRGLDYRFMTGNVPEYARLVSQERSLPMPLISHQILQRVMPHYVNWSEKCGDQFFFWHGTLPYLTVPDPELVKEIMVTRSRDFRKAPGLPELKDLLGNGLVRVDGETWAHHRLIVGPAFHMEKLKAMIPTIVESATFMLKKWQSLIDEAESRGEGRGGEIEVADEFRALTADIIARTAFGSSFRKGKQVFELQREQRFLTAEADRRVNFPGRRFLPTAKNRYRWRLKSQIRRLLREIIQRRLDLSVGRSDSYGQDLLGLMLAANKEGEEQKKQQDGKGELTKHAACSKSLSMEDIVDECKTFFFAGHETTSSLLTWTTMLLAQSPEWQDRARAEVVAACGRTDPPGSEAIAHLKIVTMVLNEALRLYPPVALVRRYVDAETRLRDVVVPKGTILLIPILLLHHSKEVWGGDAGEFKPERFRKGVSRAAKNPWAFMPFSMGQRYCVGQNLAILEAKVILCLLLQRFSFALSPAYTHAPCTLITLQPQHGMQIIFRPLPESAPSLLAPCEVSESIMFGLPELGEL